MKCKDRSCALICLLVLFAIADAACAQDARFDARPPLAAGSSLAAVTLADLDGDGDADVIGSDTVGGRLVWIESNGDADPGFTIEHEIAAQIAAPRAVAAGDLDGDGDLDIAAAGVFNSEQILWFENQGGVPPVFAARPIGPRPNLETTGIVRSVTLADLDADGDLDVVCGFFLPISAASGHVTVYLNNGAPSPLFSRFQLPSPSAALRETTSVAVGDLNGNGLTDIVATSRTPSVGDSADSVVVWFNTGSPVPGFIPTVVASGLGNPSASLVEPLASDGLPDIAVSLEEVGLIAVFANNQGSPGTFVQPQLFAASGVVDLAAADVVGGPEPDLFAATPLGPAVFENLGGPTLAFAPSLLGSPDGAVTAVALGGIDGDADTDLVAVGPGGSRWFERVDPVLNVSTGSQHASIADAVAAVASGEVLRASPEHFVPTLVLPASANEYELESSGALVIGRRASVEFQSDVVFRSAPGRKAVLGGPVAVAPGAMLQLDSTEPVEIRAGQVFADASVRSLASAVELAAGPMWLAEEISGAFAASPTPAGVAPRDVRFFRPSANGQVSIVTVSEVIGGGNSGQPGTLAVYSQSALSPTGWAALPVDALEVGAHRSIAVGDVTRDGNDDLASVFVPANGNPPTLRLHLSNGADPPVFETLLLGPAVASGAHVVFDLNRDGLADVVTPTGVYQQVDTQTFGFVPFPLVSGDRGLGVAIARLNADFEPDVVVHTAAVSGPSSLATGFRLVALEADGLGGFVPTIIDSLDRSMDPACIGDCYPASNVALTNLNTLLAADLDHDMDDDIVLGEDQGLIVYENLAGSYVAVANEADLRWAESVATDADGDGSTDLVVASTTRSAVVALSNPMEGGGQRFELLRPFERVAAVDVIDADGDDDADLVVAGSGFDRVALLRRGPAQGVELVGKGSVLGSPGEVDVVRGFVSLSGGAIESGARVRIRPGAVVRGEGTIIGDVFNGGRLAPRPSIELTDDYAQFDLFDPSAAGSLDVLLPASSADPLLVGGSAALTGDLRVEAMTGVLLGPTARRIVTAEAFDPSLNVFTTTLVPRLSVSLGGQPEPGIGVVSYGQGPAEAFVELGPQPFQEPSITRTNFASLGIPADAVVGDIAGGPNGGPDGLPDLVIAYPQLAGGKGGGVALLVGEMTVRGCDFQPIGVYQGKNADAPVAVEIGDFNGDGIAEIAFANRRDSSLANFVSFLDVNSAAQIPLTESAITPLPLPGDRRVTDLAVITLTDAALRRGPALKSTLLTLSSGGVAGIVTASTYDAAIDSWEVCDIDVCDDPDSFDPIDPDGAALLLGDGFVSSSTQDDKVLVASNTGGMPESFPTESFAAGANPTEIRAGDLNNDGFPDIVTINETGGTVSVFVNIADAGGPGGRSFAEGFEWTLRSDPDAPEPLPSSIALADLDDDGDLDIAVVSTDDAGARAVRSLTNLFVETSALSFSLPENLPTQPNDTPVLVREFDAEGTAGATVLNDDLVVLTVPPGGSSAATGPGLGMGEGLGPLGGAALNSILCSESDVCLPDANGDGQLTPADFNGWILAFNAGLPAADQNGDGLITPADFNAWITNYNEGC